MTTERKDDREPPTRAARKPYAKPMLDEYGRIADLTKHVGNNSPNADPPPHAGKFTTA